MFTVDDLRYTFFKALAPPGKPHLKIVIDSRKLFERYTQHMPSLPQ